MNEILKELKGISAFHLVTSVTFLASIVSPGVLLVFQFKRELFLELETIKLLLLSISISLPVIFASVLLVIFDDKDTVWDSVSSVAPFVTLLLFYITFLAAYLLELSFQQFIYAYGGFTLLMYALTLLERQIRKHT
ncbi:hypothetical protein GQ853_24240 [Vibrio parahaemolyticus]|nr:hypothetical protein [Vibrio parahaemolyticus]EHR1006031.1 hypothetical protein [Vibrio parahaemolyticus]EIU6865548.1 hypothetical protein [Vibrio parahaemolyticus]EIU7066096.1 hypothetical protein [Vibrio parahaemolyticus]ELB2132502.1 hypothetical protein [Vibrio parahaemolyticus]